MLKLSTIRKHSKFLSSFFIINLTAEIVSPSLAYALTGGPSQPEVQSFEPVGTSEMVDVFSGDFNYNIPLMDVGGYPINIAYHAGITMDQEASWVGLGWNLNPGVINRNMRGLPDDFDGNAEIESDEVEREVNVKPNITRGASMGVDVEIFGAGIGAGLGLNFGIIHNNYRGWSHEVGMNPSIKIGDAFKTKMGASFSYNSASGIDVNPYLSFSYTHSKKEGNVETKTTGGFNIGTGINSRSGMKSMNMGLSLQSSQVDNKGTTKASKSMPDPTDDDVARSGGGIGGNATYNFGTQTYTTKMTTPMINNGFTMNFTLGFDAFGLHPDIRVSGFQSQSKLRTENFTKRAFGYLNEHKKTDDNVLLDFNREQDNGLHDNSVNLPITNHTFDIFSVTGQGVGGSYRAFRGDIGVLHDHFLEYTNMGNASLGVEIGLGNIVHWGVDLYGTFNHVSSGKWKPEDANGFGDNKHFGQYLSKKFDFTSIGSTKDYEPSYFKPAGEMSVSDVDFMDILKGDRAVKAYLPSRSDVLDGQIEVASEYVNAKKKLPGTVYAPANSPNVNVRQKRDKRNKSMSFLNFLERRVYGLDKQIHSTNLNSRLVNGRFQRQFAWSQYRKAHHISEMTILNEDGSRYIYGIPAYNNYQIEKTFNVSERSFNCSNGQVTYGGNDNSLSNSNGDDNYYSKTKTPGYAHSFLLTGVISPDYVDITGNGISDDDFGTAVKFNYTRVSDEYRWRVPYNNVSANFQEGMKSKAEDNMGSYVYGNKEVWQMHSIESKNHIAFFVISRREDALGVLGENGGKDTSMRSYKLDRIELYNKHDYRINGSNAEPIKIVYFEYDYSLCPDVENNSLASVTGNENHGKLTLKKIYFSYGKSNKGKFSPYKFNYSDINPAYNLKGNDAWGCYKTNNDGGCDVQYKSKLTSTELSTLNNSLPSNAEFPYTSQVKEDADDYVCAWSLTEVYLPSGGKLKIEMESDDYAYVQNRAAMQMFKINEFGYKDGSNVISMGNKLYNNAHQSDVIVFDLKSSISTGSIATDSAELKRQYLEGIQDLQVTLLADVDNKNHHEYVKSYIELDWDIGCGVISGTKGWVGIKKVSYGDKKKMTGDVKVSPLSKAIWNYARINADFLVNPEGYKNSQIGLESKKERAKIPGIVKELSNLMYGFNHTLHTREFGKEVVLNRSWIRLTSPTKSKLGGGHRVKKITINDNWSEMGASNTGAADALFGQEYKYETSEIGTDNQKRTISSGVCTYEPTIGGDENPFKIPRTISVEMKMVPDEFYQLEEPMGESFFPAASIGYSRVEVKNLTRNAVKRTGTGKEVTEFYTAKDFPTIVKETSISLSKLEPKKFFSLFSLNHTTKVTATQGYTIELNDMHGKPKSKFSYAEGADKPYSGMRQIYKTDPDNPNKLYNQVPTVDQTGLVNDKLIGIDYDVVHDMNQYFDRTTTVGASVNGETFYLLISLIQIPTILPKYKKITTQVRTAVTTKIINRYGILDKTIAYQEGASIETKNLLWDSETGQILLTSVQNEFKDSVFNFTYPAHWAYEGMGQAYKNIGLTLEKIKLTSDGIVSLVGVNPEDYLVPGDECLIGNYTHIKKGVDIFIELQANYKKAFVYRGSDGKLNLIDPEGIPLGVDPDNTIYRLKVIRSGRRNLHSTPIGNITLLKNPIRGSGTNKTLVFEEIIDAQSMEYSDQWQTYLDYVKGFPCDTFFTTKTNEFIHLINDMVDSGSFNKRFKINSVYNLTSDSSDCLNLYDSFVYSYNYMYSIKRKSGGIFNHIGSIYSPPIEDDTCLYEYYGDFHDTANRFKLYDGHIYSYPNCGYLKTTYDIISNNDYYFTNSPWFDTSTLKGQFDSCSGDPPNMARVTYPNSGTSNINFAGSCCKIDFRISAPYTRIFKFYDYKATGDSTFTAKVIIRNGDCELDTVNAYFGPTCFKVTDCDFQCRSILLKSHINPYRANMEGVWRPKRSHKYLEERNYAANANTRHDGTYKSFSEFWDYDITAGKYLVDSSNPKWVWASEVTKYSPFGPELENKDALGRYSAAIYGYNYTHPVAVASNSQYTQIAYDGFEDYNYFVYGGEQICEPRHFNYREKLSENILIDDIFQHTGKYSLKVKAGNSADYTASLLPYTSMIVTPYDSSVTRITKPEDDLGAFTPKAGKYLLGAWVRCGVRDGDTSFLDPTIEVTVTDEFDVDHVYSLKGSHMIIEGWQRVEGVFDIPEGAKSIKVNLVADGEDAWFDDIRIHPFNGNMASYVYDNRTLRLMAELDANNYATFYEYDNEGGLVRQKKETINGVVTLKEVKNATVKRPNTTIVK